MVFTLQNKKVIKHDPSLLERPTRSSQTAEEAAPPAAGTVTRAKRKHQEDNEEQRRNVGAKFLLPPPSPVIESLINVVRATKSSKPTCLHFGRKEDERR
jgi:hypothetical protein